MLSQIQNFYYLGTQKYTPFQEKQNYLSQHREPSPVLASIEKQLAQENRSPCLHRAWKQMTEKDRIGDKS